MPGCPAVQDPAHPDPGGGFDPDHGGHPVAPGGRDDVADLLLAAAAVLEVEQHPVDPGRGADFRGQWRRGPEEGAEGRDAGPDGGGQRTAIKRAEAAVRRTGAHPYHRWPLESDSYSARRPLVTSAVETSAGATSHQTPAPGRSACGMTGTTITTGPG